MKDERDLIKYMPPKTLAHLVLRRADLMTLSVRQRNEVLNYYSFIIRGELYKELVDLKGVGHKRAGILLSDPDRTVQFQTNPVVAWADRVDALMADPDKIAGELAEKARWSKVYNERHGRDDKYFPAKAFTKPLIRSLRSWISTWHLV